MAAGTVSYFHSLGPVHGLGIMGMRGADAMGSGEFLIRKVGRHTGRVRGLCSKSILQWNFMRGYIFDGGNA